MFRIKTKNTSAFGFTAVGDERGHRNRRCCGGLRLAARVLGIFFILVAIAVAVLFGLGSSGGEQSRFGLVSRGGGGAISLPDLVVPSGPRRG
jgi:hypothetical protein